MSRPEPDWQRLIELAFGIPDVVVDDAVRIAAVRTRLCRLFAEGRPPKSPDDEKLNKYAAEAVLDALPECLASSAVQFYFAGIGDVATAAESVAKVAQSAAATQRTLREVAAIALERLLEFIDRHPTLRADGTYEPR